jgi:tetraacyldisaccharide 4'-kinase
MYRFFLPLSWLYEQLTTTRNRLFDNGLLGQFRPVQHTISVGNLTVGGTGKTPMIEYLVRLLLPTQPVATLSRGYGRKTKGFRIANINSDTADIIGDEPLQILRKFGDMVTVSVGEKRANALQQLHLLRPAITTVLLDDAFQHRAVQPQLNLLLCDYNRPFYTDYPFPAGLLREGRQGANRAHAVIVTKCPDTISDIEKAAVAKKIRRYTRHNTPVFFAGLRYDAPVSFAVGEAVLPGQPVVLVSGLANADPLEGYVQKQFALLQHHRFADHHAYTRADIDRLMAHLPTEVTVLTTEKDWVKIDGLLTDSEKNLWAYLPVAVRFLDNEATFQALVRSAS